METDSVGNGMRVGVKEAVGEEQRHPHTGGPSHHLHRTRWVALLRSDNAAAALS